MSHARSTSLIALLLTLPSVGVTQSVARVLTIASRPQSTAAIPATGLHARISLSLDAVPLSQALHAVARQAAVKITVGADAMAITKRVSLNAKNISAIDAFQSVLQGTRVRMTVASDGQVLFSVLRPASAAATQGTVTGKVIDAGTKRPIVGATVALPGVNKATQTADDGTFRLTGVPVGTQTVTVRRVGYAKATRTISVSDEATATVEVALETSVNTLDQVVVTGTMVETELKAVPTSITVVTAKQLEDRGITRLDQLFRGDIPGLFVLNRGESYHDDVRMFSRGRVSLEWPYTNPIKTYVDGVELADSKYLSHLDPKTIERIEIISGPQASTIYGSNAINGVMQIFTKRGTTAKPQVSLTLLSGTIENDFTSTKAPQHDHAAQITGMEGRWGYSGNVTYNHIGRWTPGKRVTRVDGAGGLRLQIGSATGDLSVRRGVSRNLQEGYCEYIHKGIETGVYRVGVCSDPQLQQSNVRGQTVGGTFSYSPWGWWSHEVGGGYDGSDTETLYPRPAYYYLSDTLRYQSLTRATRMTERYVTTLRAPLTSVAQATVTLGADHWRAGGFSQSARSSTLTGSLSNPSLTRNPIAKNTGGLMQTQLAILDAVFLTYGLRAEWNPNYGKEAQPNIAPRYGVAFTRDMGPLTTKLRASYGRSTRPPSATLKMAEAQTYQPYIVLYGMHDTQLANPELGPEFQQGGEGGLELYFGTRGSLIVTRYNQTVDDLIARPKVDSVRSLTQPSPGTCTIQADGYCYSIQSQNLNIGSIRNNGWELQGTGTFGPLSAKGTYSWNRSRMIGITPKYRPVLQGTQYERGTTLDAFPEHTWAGQVTYASRKTSLSVNLNGIGFMNTQYSNLYYALVFNRMNVQLPRVAYNGSALRYPNPAYVTAGLSASHRFSELVESVLQVENLTNEYATDADPAWAQMGRTGKVGVRLRW